jgi:hypothetical protein
MDETLPGASQEFLPSLQIRLRHAMRIPPYDWTLGQLMSCNCQVVSSIATTIFLLAAGVVPLGAAEPETPNFRRPATDAELRYWLENMLVQHRWKDIEAEFRRIEATGWHRSAR